MGQFQQEIAAGNVLSYHDGRSGSFRDLVGANDGTATSVVLNREGFVFDGVGGDLDTGSDYIGTAAVTIIARIKPNSAGEAGVGRILTNNRTELFCNNTLFGFESNGTTTISSGVGSLTASLGKSIILAVSRDATGANSNFYIDGIQSGTANLDSGTPTSGTSNVLIGNRTVDDQTFNGTISWVTVLTGVKTNSEINQISAEIDGMTWTTKVTTRAQQEFPFPSQLVDADMENSGVADWTVFNAATLTKQTGTRTGGGGKQVLRITYGGTANPGASQAVNTAGNLYRVTGYARGDGTAVPRFGDNSATRWTGTSSTDWQYFDVTYAQAGGGTAFLLSTLAGAGYVEFDDVQILGNETPKSADTFHTDWGAYETVANVTAGQISNTPFQRVSGTWSITPNTVNGSETKEITHVAAGLLSLDASYLNQTNTELAYGTWEATVRWLTGDILDYGFIVQSLAAFSADDYYVRIAADGTLTLQQHGTGAIITAGTTLATGVPSRIRLTRTGAGVFVLYLDGISQGTATVATTTASVGWLFDLDATSATVLSDRAGNHSLVKKLGV